MLGKLLVQKNRAVGGIGVPLSPTGRGAARGQMGQGAGQGNNNKGGAVLIGSRRGKPPWPAIARGLPCARSLAAGCRRQGSPQS